MRLVKKLPPLQFALFRIIFGIYLSVHFAQLIPYGPEIFSSEGVLPDAKLNATSAIFPNPLAHCDSPAAITIFLVVLTLLSVCFAMGLWRRTCAILLWFGWACLFNRNNLISNPSIPYVGMLLLISALVPNGEPLSLQRRRISQWQFPAMLYWTPWLLLAAGYTFSGVVKLQSPSWIDGSALLHLVNNPLARPGFFRDLFLSLPPWAITLATWGVLAAEIVFLPLSVHRLGRMFGWTAMVLVHIGILLMVDFADLTIGMLMAHFYVFDRDWLPGKTSAAASESASRRG